MDGTRPNVDIGGVLTAIEETSAELSQLSERIVALEASNYRIEEDNNRLRVELAEMIETVEAAQVDALKKTKVADIAQAKASSHQQWADRAGSDLTAANDDITRIATAVTSIAGR